jgi:hypothetical protein
VQYADLNGDGLADMIFQGNDNRFWVSLSTGSGFTAPANWITHGGGFNNASAQYTDLNGDGLTDLIYRGLDNQFHVSLMAGVLPNFLISLSPGLSSSISLSYKPITDSSIYVKGVLGETGTTECPFPKGDNNVTNSYPVINLQESVYVVSSATVSDGNGGVLTNNYSYGELKADLKGRGSLGFRYQKVTQADADINSTTFFRQDYPYIGLPCQTEKRVNSTNTLVNASVLSYANAPKTEGSAISQFPYLTQSVEQNFELNGNLINTTTKTNQYDGYGNATQIVVNSGDGYSKTTTNVYYNDTSNGNWLLGRLLRSTVTSTAP